MSDRGGLKRLLLLAVMTAGCTAVGVRDVDLPQGWQERQRQDRIMVVLEPAPEPLWKEAYRNLAVEYDLRGIAAWTMISLGAPCVVYELPSDADGADVVRRLGADHRVQLAQAVQAFEVLEGRQDYNDPYQHMQHGSQAIRAEQAHEWATGKGVKIAVIDTGVEISHPDLEGRIAGARNFVDRGDATFTQDRHGTSIVGVIAAVANNEIGIVGIAPEAEILALKACWPANGALGGARCDSYTLALAIDFALSEEAEVLNLSLAGPEDPLLARLLTEAIDRGVIVVAARDDRIERAGGFPASLEGVLSIGSSTSSALVDRDGALVAPGVDILTTVPPGSYDFLTGSSFAAAHASGVVALLLERQPGLTPEEVTSVLRATAMHEGESVESTASARIDACAAIGRVVQDRDCSDRVIAVRHDSPG